MKKIQQCEVGTPVRLKHDYGYGCQLVYNHRHNWIKNFGKERCLSCGKTPKEVGYGNRKIVKH